MKGNREMACVNGEIHTYFRGGKKRFCKLNKDCESKTRLHITGLAISCLEGGSKPACLGFGLSLGRPQLIPDTDLFFIIFVCVFLLRSAYLGRSSGTISCCSSPGKEVAPL